MVRWSWRRVNVTPEDILSGAQSLEVGARRYEIDVASHCQGSTWSSIHNERRQRMGTVHGYPPLRRVSQVVEEMLRELTIADIQDIEEGGSSHAQDSG